MSQISRPFQIALLAVAVLGAAWLFVFQPHPSSTATSSSSAAVVSTPPASTSAASGAKGAGSPSKIYHGSAPGVQGLTRAVAHAHEAVAKSQQNAKALEQKSAQASGQPSTSASSATPTSASVTKSAATPAKSKPASKPTSTPAAKSHAPAANNTHSSIPVGQRDVEAQLAQGNVAVVLFWNPAGAEDKADRLALRSLRTTHHKKVAIDVASASQTASFGAITRGIQVYGTPTMLVVNKHGKAIVLTGLQDTFSIQQAVEEARLAA